MTTAELKKIISESPSVPGIYMFTGKGGRYLYAGKAANLKSRVSSYRQTEDRRIQKMLNEAIGLKFTETDSEIEALILESQFIKKHKPAFNIMLRDDKNFGFVGFTNEEFPKLFITHQPTKIRNSNIETRNNIKYRNSKYQTVSNLKISDLEFVSDFGGDSIGSSSTGTFALKFRASDFNFIGPFTDIGALKTTLRYLRRVFPYCTCKKPHNNFCLNYHISKCLGFCCLKDSPERSRRIAEEKQYIKNIKAIKDILSGKKVSLLKKLEKEMVIAGEKQKFEEAIALQNKIEKIKRVFENASIIRNSKFLGVGHRPLPGNSVEIRNSDVPRRIEGYDIANIQGKYAVGVMTVFTNGKPDKNEYRKFKIYTKNSPDDAAMLKEVLTRRFKHTEWPLPDQILIDGGKAQLNAAVTALRKSRINNQELRIIALTKNEKHKGVKILAARNKNPVPLSKLPAETRNLFLQINSEAHRFAINYYRKLHRRNIKAAF